MRIVEDDFAVSPRKSLLSAISEACPTPELAATAPLTNRTVNDFASFNLFLPPERALRPVQPTLEHGRPTLRPPFPPAGRKIGSTTHRSFIQHRDNGQSSRFLGRECATASRRRRPRRRFSTPRDASALPPVGEVTGKRERAAFAGGDRANHRRRSLISSTLSARVDSPSTPVPRGVERGEPGRTAIAPALPVVIDTRPPGSAHRQSWLTTGFEVVELADHVVALHGVERPLSDRLRGVCPVGQPGPGVIERHVPKCPASAGEGW